MESQWAAASSNYSFSPMLLTFKWHSPLKLMVCRAYGHIQNTLFCSEMCCCVRWNITISSWYYGFKKHKNKHPQLIFPTQFFSSYVSIAFSTSHNASSISKRNSMIISLSLPNPPSNNNNPILEVNYDRPGNYAPWRRVSIYQGCIYQRLMVCFFFWLSWQEEKIKLVMARALGHFW